MKEKHKSLYNSAQSAAFAKVIGVANRQVRAFSCCSSPLLVLQVYMELKNRVYATCSLVGER